MVIFTIFMMFQRYLPEVTDEHFMQHSKGTDEATFTIQTNKQRLNQLIASRIKEEPAEMPYMVELLEDHVQFRSAISVLGQRVPITINFLPEVLENGDLLLRVETFTLGLLNLPVEQVLQLITSWIDLADWIITYPADRVVEVKVTSIKLDENESIYFKFTTFDLEEDLIELEMVIQ